MTLTVIPAQAGIQPGKTLDARVSGHDETPKGV